MGNFTWRLWRVDGVHLTCSQNDVQATYLIYCNCFGAISFLMTLSCRDSLSCGARRVCILRESVIYILRDATVSLQEKQPDYLSSILRRYDQITSLSCGMADFGSLSCGRINVHPDRHRFGILSTLSGPLMWTSWVVVLPQCVVGIHNLSHFRTF